MGKDGFLLHCGDCNQIFNDPKVEIYKTNYYENKKLKK